MEFLATDGKTPSGFDIDLFTAVAAKLGLKATYENTKFDSILIGVQSGKYDVGLSSFGITRERLGALTMVSYLSVGTQWAVEKGNPGGVQPDAACGKKVAVQTATTQEADLEAKSAACTKAGGPAIDILAEQDGQLPFNDVRTSKAEAALSRPRRRGGHPRQDERAARDRRRQLRRGPVRLRGRQRGHRFSRRPWPRRPTP